MSAMSTVQIHSISHYFDARFIISFHCTIARLTANMTDTVTIWIASACLILTHHGPFAPQEKDLHKH